MVICTVRSFTTSTPMMFLSWNAKSRDARLWLPGTPRKASRLSLTTWAVSGSPSWKVTPLWRVSVHTLKVGSWVSVLARYGT